MVNYRAFVFWGADRPLLPWAKNQDGQSGRNTFGEGTPDWMYRVPPFRMLDPGDHMMDRYIKHAKTWAEAAKAGAADVE